MMKRQLVLWSIVCSLTVYCRAQSSNLQRADVAAPRLADQGRGTDTAFIEKHESFVQRAKQGNIDLLFLGDSITSGFSTRGRDIWQKYYGNLNAANFAIVSDQTQNVL